MKKFILRIIYYALSCVLILGLMTQIVDSGLKKTNNDLYGDWNRLLNNKIKDDIIIVGNSRAKVHFNPEIIEENTGYSCYNLGKDATNLFLQQTVINSVIEHVKPKYLVISMDIGSLQKKEEIFEKEQYLPYIDNPSIYPILAEIDKKVVIEEILPIVKYRGQFSSIYSGMKSHFLIDNTYNKSKGFFGSTEEWNSDFSNFEKLMNGDKIVLSKSEIENGLFLLEDIISKCEKSGIQLILCQPPRFRELYKYFPQKTEVDKKIENIALQKNVLYFDFSYDELHEDKSYFYNASHLNIAGANKFSQKFSALLNEKLNR